jgi:polyhydroxyalkanoate synthesis regulator phasin
LILDSGKHIDDIQLKEMSDVLRDALLTNNDERARQVAQEMVKKGELIGPAARKKTMLAHQIVQDLNAGRRVPKQTQMALDDAARIADLPS